MAGAARARRATSIRPTHRRSSANTRRRPPRRPTPRSPRRSAAFPGLVARRRRRSGTTSCARVASEIAARREELGRLLAREEGKTLPEAIGEVGRAAQIFDFFAGEALRIPGEKFASVRPGVDIEVTREPVGVVGIIAPWNFPIAIPAWKIAPALCYGNCVVFKPADLVPGSAHALAEIIVRAGVPKGVFNLVMGRGSMVGQAMLDHPDVDAITFTGSVATGRKVARGLRARDAQVPARNGRQEPARRARRRRSARPRSNARSTAPIFSTGQRCTASSRLIVTRGHLRAFRRRRWPSGCSGARRRRRAESRASHIGPVVDQSQLDQDLAYVHIGRDEGAKLALGGERLNRATPGFYMAPALFVDADNAMRIAREEIFGPVAAMIPARDYEHALALANDTEFGLVRRHLHDEPEVRHAFQAQRRGRHGDGQPADGGRRLSRAVRRPQRLEPRLARAGPLRRGVLHDASRPPIRWREATRTSRATAA